MSDVVIVVALMVAFFWMGVRVGVSMMRQEARIAALIVEDTEAAMVEDAADQAIDVDDWSNDTPWLETQS